MRIVSQLERYNKRETDKAISGSRKAFTPTESMHEASVMAGEMIARINNDHKTTVEEVIKTYKPNYLRKRGVI